MKPVVTRVPTPIVTPVVTEDELTSERTTEPDVLHDIFSWERGDETRTYSMRVVPGGAELWRLTESPEAGIQSIKEGDFKSSEEAAGFLAELRRALTAGGWREA